MIENPGEVAMGRPDLLRSALWCGAVLNAAGAVLFLFPGSLGQLAALPAPFPILYSWFCGAVIAIFGVAFAVLARQEAPNPDIVWVAAIGKLAFFAICVASWLLGESAMRLVVLASPDVALAGIFLLALRRRSPKPGSS